MLGYVADNGAHAQESYPHNNSLDHTYRIGSDQIRPQFCADALDHRDAQGYKQGGCSGYQHVRP
jgi:hypothetical protein